MQPAFCRVGAVLYQLRPVPLAVRKSLTRGVKSSLQAEGTLGGLQTLKQWLVVSLRKVVQLSSLPVLLSAFSAIPLTVAPFCLPAGSLEVSGDSTFSSSSVFTITR